MTAEPDSSESASSIVKEVLPFLATVDQTDEETIDILKQKCKSKPYHAVMRILLYVWSKERRKLVTKELQQLNVLRSKDLSATAVLEMSPFTSLIWDKLNVNTYYLYVNRHKSYVSLGYGLFNEFVIGTVKPRLFSEGLLLDMYLPTEDPTAEQIKVHDDSKYSFVETVTYAMKWYPCQALGKSDDDAWESGLDHHYCHNEHHPEHWGNKPMHWRYIVEAMYDMTAMELERRFVGKEPDNKAKLLLFDPMFMRRFERTGQLELAQMLVKYTIEAYCKSTGHQVPSLND